MTTVERLRVAAVGDSNDPGTWSGIPFHLVHAGQRAGVIFDGLALDEKASRIKLQRLVWNSLELIRTRSSGGYQFTQSFVEALWSAARVEAGDAIVYCSQLYPESVLSRSGVSKWVYIDQTLEQLFDFYGLRSIVSERICAEAIARERDQYQRLNGIFTLSTWARSYLVERYGVPSNRVHVVLPGANIRETAVASWEKHRHRPDREELRLVFVGKDWRRKGLDRLISGMKLAQSRGAPISLLVIGPRQQDVPSELSSVDAVRWYGFLDKGAETSAFVEEVGACDVGCMLSYAECSPIGVREYARLGLATLVTDTGGTVEQGAEGATIVLNGDAGPEAVADSLYSLALDRSRRKSLIETAWRTRARVCWARAASEMKRVILKTAEEND